MGKLYIPVTDTLVNELAKIRKIAGDCLLRDGEFGYTTENGYFHLYVYASTPPDGTTQYVIEPNRMIDGGAEPMGNTYSVCAEDGIDTLVSEIEWVMKNEFVLTEVEIILNGQKCVAHEAVPGKMRLRLMGTFGNGEEKEAYLLIPTDMVEEEIENLQSMWLCEQERKLGLSVGDSVSSAGFDIGWGNDDADEYLTGEYKELVEICYKSVLLYMDDTPCDEVPWYKSTSCNQFAVRREWLRKYLLRHEQETVEYFLRHYLYDDAVLVYDTAKKEGAIVWENNSESKPDTYFVQTFNPDNTLSGGLHTPTEILNMVGFADCSGCRHIVYDYSTFGEMIRLEHEPNTKAPYNYHSFVNPRTGEVAFEGYSEEH